MSSVISPFAGTRVDPIDSLRFIRGTTGIFKTTFLSNSIPTKVDVGTVPTAKIFQPKFLNDNTAPVPVIVASIDGVLVSGQEYEYQFSWDIPPSLIPLNDYIVSYNAFVGGVEYNFGDEYFTILGSAGSISLQQAGYATVSDIRETKFNIDQYLPSVFRNDLQKRDSLIQKRINDASTKLREELNLFKARGNTANNRLFTIYYTVWSILLSARGEDGSSVSDQNLKFWQEEWSKILAQEKRESQMQSVPLGRG